MCEQLARPSREGCATLGDDDGAHCERWRALLAAKEAPRQGCAAMGRWEPVCLLLLTGDESACAGGEAICRMATPARIPLAAA